MMRFLMSFCVVAVLTTGVLSAGFAQEVELIDEDEDRRAAEALMGPSGPPAPATPQYVALMYHRLAETVPDFMTWATWTKAYIEAADFDKAAVQLKEATTLKDTFKLMTLNEPFIVDMPAVISDYSESNQGFFVQNFREDLFFPYTYGDQNYAVVPVGLMDHQWLPATTEQARKLLEARAASADGILHLYIFMAPKFADATGQIEMEDAKFWLVSADILKTEIYVTGTDTPVWESNPVERDDDPAKQEILKLYQ